jgi:putative transposase
MTSSKSWNGWWPSAARRSTSAATTSASSSLASSSWLAQRQVKTLYIEPGSPWQNGHVESFNGSLRDECLDREVMLSVAEARVLIEDYRRHYNEERPHGGIGYRTPAQARREALDSSRPPGSLRPELDPSQPTSMIPS